jgi:replicative DNA helicase
MVIFIHRPEKYGITEDEEGNSTIGLAEIMLAKHRNGAIGDIHLRFRAEFAKFQDLEEDFVTPSAELQALESGQSITLSSRMNEDFKKSRQNNDFLPNMGFDSGDAPF